MRFSRCEENRFASVHRLLTLRDVDDLALQHYVKLCLLLDMPRRRGEWPEDGAVSINVDFA